MREINYLGNTVSGWGIKETRTKNEYTTMAEQSHDIRHAMRMCNTFSKQLSRTSAKRGRRMDVPITRGLLLHLVTM